MAFVKTNFPKHPWDERRIAHDFSDELAKAIIAGDTIASIDSITVYDGATGTDVTATGKKTSSEQIAADAKSVSAIYTGGTVGQTYWMVARVVTANGEKISGIIVMEIGKETPP